MRVDTEYVNPGDREWADEQMRIQLNIGRKRRGLPLLKSKKKFCVDVSTEETECVSCGQTIVRSKRVIDEAKKLDRGGCFCGPCGQSRKKGWSLRKRSG